MYERKSFKERRLSPQGKAPIKGEEPPPHPAMTNSTEGNGRAKVCDRREHRATLGRKAHTSSFFDKYANVLGPEPFPKTC